MLAENIKINLQSPTNNENEVLRVAIYQMDIVWENKKENIRKVLLQSEKLTGKADLLVLPEMFSTGFSMNTRNLAEPNDGDTITTLKACSHEQNLAICGSFMAQEEGKIFNRGFFITPQGQISFYDKRHLFRMGEESEFYTAGNSLPIINYKDFNICLLICYDLRFPVWSRNVNNKYDLLIYVANWPKSRIAVWNTLLAARSLENQAFVCGSNRVGKDGIGLIYNGYSNLFNFKGETVTGQILNEDKEICQTVEINKKELKLFRNKFSVWKDMDKFTLNI